MSRDSLQVAREVGYQADDRVGLSRALDKIKGLDVKVTAQMHGPTLTGHFDKLYRCFRENSLVSTAV
jgi:flavorubredoxin